MYRQACSISALAICTVLVSCGGSSGTGSGQQATPPPAAYASVEQALVTAVPQGQDPIYSTPFGQFVAGKNPNIIVDGQQIPTFLLDDPNNPFGQLVGPGETVQLAGVESSNGSGASLLTVDRIEIDHLLDGPVQSIDRQHAQLTVLGLTVEIHPGTVLAVDPAKLNPGDVVIVSGNATLSGRIIASRIASGSGAPYLVSAYVSSVDQAQRQFMIGNLTVDYSGAPMPDGAPMVGQRVQVRGAPAATAGIFTASSVEVLPIPILGNAGVHVHLFGLVTKDAPPPQSLPLNVQVEGVPVVVATISPADYCGPAIQDSLVSLSGILQPDGSIAANFTCQYGEWGPFGLQGQVTAIDAAHGTLSVLGYGVQPSLATQFFSSRNEEIAAPAFKVGDSVSIVGARGTADGTMLAVSVQALASAGTGNAVVVHDVNFSLAAPSAFVLGRPITLTPDTAFTGLLKSMTMQDFFTQPLPKGDPLCGADYSFNVVEGADSALTATSIDEHVNWGYC